MSPGFEPADVSNCDNKMMGKVPPEPRERILEEGQGRPGGGLVVSTSVASGGGGHSFQDMKSEIWRETEGLNTLNPKLRPSVPRGRSFWWVMGVWYWRGWASEVGPRKADLRPCSSSVSADP